MGIKTQKFVRKPLFVDAVRVTANNMDEVAAWCEGEVLWEEDGRGAGKKYVKVRVHQPMNTRQSKAFVGDWILYTDKGYKIYINRAFRSSFDESKEATKEELEAAFGNGKKYPHEDGSVIVLGPEVFIAKDNSVISYKGENFVPQKKPVEEPKWTQKPEYQPNMKPCPDCGFYRPVHPETQEFAGRCLSGVCAESTEMAQARETIEAEGGTVEVATAEAIAEVVTEEPFINTTDHDHVDLVEDANRQIINGDIPETVEDVPEQEDIVPAAAEGKRVLSIKEQREMTSAEVKALVQAGEAVLVQDIAQP